MNGWRDYVTKGTHKKNVIVRNFDDPPPPPQGWYGRLGWAQTPTSSLLKYGHFDIKSFNVQYQVVRKFISIKFSKKY